MPVPIPEHIVSGQQQPLMIEASPEAAEAATRNLAPGSFQPVAAREPGPEMAERRPVNLSDVQKQRLCRMLRRYYNEATQNKDNQKGRRAERYRRYLADPSLRAGLQPWPDAPQLFLPMTRSVIESLKTNLSAELFESLEKVVVEGIGQEDRQSAKRAGIFFRWWLEKLVKIRKLSSDVMLDALIDSLAILKVYPWTNPYPPLHENATYFQTECKMEAVDLGDMLIPPDATGLQFPDARYLGQRLYLHPDNLIDMQRRGFQVPDLSFLMGEESRSLDDRDWTDDERKLIAFERLDIEPEPDPSDPHIEVVEFYVLFAPEVGEQRQFFVVHWMPRVRGRVGVEDRDGLIMRVARLQDAIPQSGFSKPTWPFFDIKLWGQARQLHGMDVPTRLESVQDLLNRQAEQMLNDGDISVLPFFFYNAALTGELPDLTEIKPGSGVPIDNSGQVYFPPRQSNNRHYTEQMLMADRWAEKDSNVTAHTQGRSPEQPNAPRTLGGQQLLMEAANKVYNEQTQLLADQWQGPLMMAFSIWQHRLPPSVQIPMPDLQGLSERLLDGSEVPTVLGEVRHEDLQGLFDVHIEVDPEQFLKQQRQLQLAGLLDEKLAPIWPLGQRELWKQLWEMMQLKDFDKLWPEQVAVAQTQILIMRAEITMAQLEIQLSAVQQAQALQAAEALLSAILNENPEDASAAQQHQATQGQMQALQGQAGGVQGLGPQPPQGPAATGNAPPQNRTGKQ